MNIKLLQENLLRALTHITRVVPSKPQLPILQNVKLSATKEGLEITATNMETTETIWVGGKVEKEGSVCVSARVLFEFIATLPPETVHLQVKEEELLVSCVGFEAQLPTTNPSDFPSPPAFSSKQTGSVNKHKLIAALSSVLFSAATDEGRPVLTGVRIIEDGEKTTFVTTDGYRLSLRKGDFSTIGSLAAIVPARALAEVVKLSGEEKTEDMLKIGLAGENQIGLTIGETTLLTRLLDG